MSGTEISIAPLGRPQPGFSMMALAAPTIASPAPVMVQDQMSFTGGTARVGDAAVMAAQADQLLVSTNLQDRFAGLLATARLAQVDSDAAMVRLQQVANAPGQDPQVVAFANRYIATLQASPKASGIQTLGQGAGVSQSQGFGSPLVMQPGTFASQPASQPTQVIPGMGMRPEDSSIVLQMLRDDLNAGGPKGALAIRQMAQIAQTNPETRENVFRLLVNHIYYKEDASVGEAINALVAMNDPRSGPYIAAVARKPGLLDSTRDVALNAMKVMAQQQAATPGASGTVSNGRASIEYLRTMELELRKGGPDGIAAVAEMRQALAPNPVEPSAARNEVTRALLTYLRTGAECSTMNAAIQLLTEMRSREALPYLDWVSRQPGILDQTREVARNAVRTIAMG